MKLTFRIDQKASPFNHPNLRARPSARRRGVGSAMVAALLFAAVPVFAQTALTVNDDGAHRSPDIRWPSGFTPEDADLYAHNQIDINAPCSRVWKHLIAAPTWPSWYSNAQNVHLVGTRADHLQRNTSFSFDTFGAHFNAKVAEFVPNERLAWFGKGTGNIAYHAWLLTGAANSCTVVTEEVAKGPNALLIRQHDANAMHKGHDLWLQGLKTVSEK
jgi:Polyketide cyclase / dehydrase and lipid transport